MYTILSGTVGSTAYGLADENSDKDTLGIFTYKTEALLGLHKPKETHTTTNPDVTLHEAAKFCRLALGCNPTVLELLWLPEDLYEIRTHSGLDLIEIRESFLSAKRVRDAYLGYATQQFKKLESRGDGSFSADTRKRTAKHARHLLRLCYQGFLLYQGAGLKIRLSEEEAKEIKDFGDDVASGNIQRAREAMVQYEYAFDKLERQRLPEHPDEEEVEKWLIGLRRTYTLDTNE